MRLRDTIVLLTTWSAILLIPLLWPHPKDPWQHVSIVVSEQSKCIAFDGAPMWTLFKHDEVYIIRVHGWEDGTIQWEGGDTTPLELVRWLQSFGALPQHCTVLVASCYCGNASEYHHDGLNICPFNSNWHKPIWTAHTATDLAIYGEP